MKPLRIFNLTALAMIAFAGNSLLCRFALNRTAIDPATFTSVRIFSGALMLWLIVKMRHRKAGDAGSWPSAFTLFVYAAGFSFAYVSLTAATGALLLFVAVQGTMITAGIVRGERMRLPQWLGVAIAFAGFVVLLLPGIAAPPLFSAVLMLGAGVAWGVYSLRGKQSGDATLATAGNFLRAVPMTIILSGAYVFRSRIDGLGVLYAFISGAITSGLGYVIWYAVLPSLRRTTAATVQLSAPVLAALGGILLLHETITIRFILCAFAVLGGIALVVLEKRRT